MVPLKADSLTPIPTPVRNPTRNSSQGTAWDRDYWTPKPLWAGRTVFVLGGGPSLREFNAECLRGFRTIAVNSSFRLIPWADVLLFLDQGWMMSHLEEVKNFKGLVVSTSLEAKRTLPYIIKRIQVVIKDSFEDREKYVRMGPSSGHVGVSLAIALGAKRIVLLGFDMKVSDDGRTHFHNDYPTNDTSIYQKRFIPAFEGWNRQALNVGVEVINATPNSALHEFPKDSLESVLAREFSLDENEIWLA